MPSLTSAESTAHSAAQKGAAAAFGAYLLWGTLPLYWKMLDGLPVVELMAHRIIWTLATVLAFQALRGRWRAFRQTWAATDLRRIHARGGVFVTINWAIFVWALLNEQIIEASLGYFLVPLVSAALGRILFQERINQLQKTALGLAGLGVVVLFTQISNLPWVSLGIATSWCLYGVGRKRSDASPLNGLGVELTFVFPVALAYVGWLLWSGDSSFGQFGWAIDTTIIGTGFISMIPLVLFAYAAKRLTYTTLGLLQYIAPTCQFLVGWLIYDEPFVGVRVAGFCLIWAGLVCYVAGTLRRNTSK